MEPLKEIERSIIKKYRKDIWSKFIEAVKEYELIKDEDHIAVCISGGKDSFLLAKCMQELKRHGKIKFELKFLVMDPGYESKNRKQIEDNLKNLGIEASIFSTSIFSYVDTTDNPCYLCAKMRRGYLYHEAKKLGCNKIALGHHFNDVVETILLNLIFNGEFSSMMPKLKSDNFEGIELIRPLYLIREKDIKTWAKTNGLTFLDCACQITKKKSGKRMLMKDLTEQLNAIYKNADKCIFHATKNVNLNTMIAYKKDQKIHHFLDYYKED